jgi:hypothetical protein
VIPREGELDLLAEAEAAFVPPQRKKSGKPKKAKAPTSVDASPKKAKGAAQQPQPRRPEVRVTKGTIRGLLRRTLVL